MDVVSKLEETEKGRLSYSSTRNHLIDIEKSFTISKTKKVFELNDLKYALEFCEDAAFAEEKSHRVSGYEMSSKDNDISEQHTQDVPLYETTLINSWCNHTEIVVDVIKEELKREQVAGVEEKLRLFEESAEISHRMALEKYERLQAQRQEKLLKCSESVTKYINESKENANRIKQENIDKRRSQSHKLKTRLQEAQERQLQKVRQGMERLNRAQQLHIKSEERLKQMFFHNANFPVFRDHDQVTGLVSDVEQTFTKQKTLIESCGKVMDQSELEQVEADFQHLLSVCIIIEDNAGKLKAAAEEELAEKMRRVQVEKEETERRLAEQRAKEIREKNPEMLLPALPPELKMCVSCGAYQRYKELRLLLNKFEEESKNFTSSKDKAVKRMIMDLSKAIGVSISSITNRAGSDVKIRLADLNGLLKGDDVRIGNRTVNTRSLPEALSYSRLFMAEKFVKQAEGQVSSNHATAFCLALTVLGVWTADHNFGNLLLAQLQARCPFVIPMYVPQLEGQSAEKYNRARGYLYSSDGVAEAQDMYLKRMSGLVRTYAAIIQSPLPPGAREHPHGIEHGWIWLTRMLNLDPWPEVTATVLYDFLDVAGHAMMETYGRQFEKLLYAICHDYFPRIEEVSGKGGGGPVQRLLMFLKECIKLKKVRKPEGRLDGEFWNTYHHAGVVGN